MALRAPAATSPLLEATARPTSEAPAAFEQARRSRRPRRSRRSSRSTARPTSETAEAFAEELTFDETSEAPAAASRAPGALEAFEQATEAPAAASSSAAEKHVAVDDSDWRAAQQQRSTWRSTTATGSGENSSELLRIGPMPMIGNLTHQDRVEVREVFGCSASVRARRNGLRSLTVVGPPDTVQLAWEFAQDRVRRAARSHQLLNSGLVAVAGATHLEGFSLVRPTLGANQVLGDRSEPAYVYVRADFYAGVPGTVADGSTDSGPTRCLSTKIYHRPPPRDTQTINTGDTT